MHGLSFIITIAEHRRTDRIMRFFREEGAAAVMSMPCEGTAQSDVLGLMGLEDTEKTAFFVLAGEELRTRIMRGLVYKMMIDAPGAGIALSVPVGSISSGAVRILVGESVPEGSGEKTMNDMPYALICVIANSGCTDMVMDAARGANARGGTVLHVKGAGAAHAEKFFGMSIADEKEMILIAARKADCSGIMKAVMSEAGLNTRAHAICFSMPIDEIAGFRLAPVDPEA